MIPYDVDPTLHSEEPQDPKLDDGFTPPGVAQDQSGDGAGRDAAQTILPDKSDF